MANSTAVQADTLEADDWTDGGLNELLGYHVRMANLAIYRDFISELGDLDMTQKQAATLSMIDANPGLPQVAIATQLGADRATIMAMIDRLQGRGLVRRERSKLDRRRQELYLTEAGQKLLAEARKRIADHEKRFTSRFTAAELRGLFKALKKLHGLP